MWYPPENKREIPSERMNRYDKQRLHLPDGSIVIRSNFLFQSAQFTAPTGRYPSNNIHFSLLPDSRISRVFVPVN